MSQEPKSPDTPQANEPLSEKRDERNAWRDEQKKHDYYYDDAHGYEHYNPDSDEDDETPNAGSK